jgi:predicted nucleic-acid-binding protein
VIGLDTNVLVRYIVQDHPAQSAIAASFLESALTPAAPGYVSAVALIELAWVLEKAYGATSADVREVVQRLMDAQQVHVEHADAVGRALALDHADLADALILEVGRGAGCDRTVTFDRAFARLTGVELLA